MTSAFNDDPSVSLHQRALDRVQTGVLVCEAVKDQTQTIIDFRYVYANRQAGQWLGLNADELPGHTLRELYPPGQPLLDRFRDVFRTKQSLRFDFERLPVRGLTHCWFEVQVQPLDEGIMVLLTDITDKYLIQQQLAWYAENLQAVLNGSPASVIFLKTIKDEADLPIDFRLAVCNDNFARISRRSVTELMGQSFELLAPLLWGTETFKGLMNVFMTRMPRYEECLLPGTDRWLGLSISRQDEGVLISALDITDLKQMQQQQEALASQVRLSGKTVDQLAKLQEQVRSRGALLRTSSHDLRGSLGVIQGAAGLLAYANSDEERGQMLDMLQRNVQEVTQMLTDLLDYTRFEAGQEQLQLLPLDATELLTQFGHHVEPLVEQKGMTFRQEGPDSLFVQSDALHISRMAQSLVLNALKQSESIVITLRWGEYNAQMWYFSVTSQVPPRSPAAPAGEEASPTLGEAMGLQIVRQLCDLLHGQVRAEHDLDSSTIRVALPKRY